METPETGLAVDVRRDGESAAIVVAGELDMSAVDELRAAARVARDGVERVVLDVRRLTFIDSSGLGSLIELRREFERHGIAFVVEATDGPVREAIETTGLSEMLGVR